MGTDTVLMAISLLSLKRLLSKDLAVVSSKAPLPPPRQSGRDRSEYKFQAKHDLHPKVLFKTKSFRKHVGDLGTEVHPESLLGTHRVGGPTLDSSGYLISRKEALTPFLMERERQQISHEHDDLNRSQALLPPSHLE